MKDSAGAPTVVTGPGVAESAAGFRAVAGPAPGSRTGEVAAGTVGGCVRVGVSQPAANAVKAAARVAMSVLQNMG